MAGHTAAAAVPAHVTSWLFLAACLVGAAFTWNAFVPARRSRWLLLPSFVFAMFVAELAALHLLWQLLATVVFVALGALSAWPGQLALALAIGSWLGLVVLVVQGRSAVRVMAATLGPLRRTETLPWSRLALPFPLRRTGARVTRDVVYARPEGIRLRLDVYRPPPGIVGPRPAVIQIHGGAWVVGDKREQGVPLMTQLSDRGFVGFNVNYRLCPRASWPDPLVDIKRAIAWVREHAAQYDVDPGFVAITGGSAGGHLAAMAALTAGDASLQPGFEQADTRVQVAVPLYGVYDLTDRNHQHAPGFMARLIEPLVIKARLRDEPGRFRDASPLDRIHADAPPFFVIHGDRDTLAPLSDARAFVAALREVSRAPVWFAELAGAHHSFDVFLSPRSLPVIEGVGDVLEHLWQRAREASAHP